MLLDQQLLFSDAQALTATANSTNIIDMSNISAAAAAPARNLGAGEPIHLYMKVGTVSGTSPTLTAALVGADDSSFATNKITIASVTPTLTVSQADAFVRFGIPSHTAKRFYRMEYTVGGTTPAVTVSAGFVFDEQVTSMT